MPSQPKLLDRVRQVIRSRRYSRATERAYVGWIRKFIFFHRLRHPEDLGSNEIIAFLSHLATRHRVSPGTQNQAMSALLFLYRQVLHRQLPDLEGVVRPKRRGPQISDRLLRWLRPAEDRRRSHEEATEVCA